MINNDEKMANIVNTLNSLNDVFKDALAESGIRIDWYYKDVSQAQDSECEELEIFFRDEKRKTMDIYFKRFSSMILIEQEKKDFYMAMRVMEQRPMYIKFFKNISSENLKDSCFVIVAMMIRELKQYIKDDENFNPPERYSHRKILDEVNRTWKTRIRNDFNLGDK